jgi:hypothetical protein
MSEESIPPSPTGCSHWWTLCIQPVRSCDPSGCESITVCHDCGQFRISAHRGGVPVVTTFELRAWDLVDAAAQYARRLDRASQLEVPELPSDVERKVCSCSLP